MKRGHSAFLMEWRFFLLLLLLSAVTAMATDGRVWLIRVGTDGRDGNKVQTGLTGWLGIAPLRREPAG